MEEQWPYYAGKLTAHEINVLMSTRTGARGGREGGEKASMSCKHGERKRSEDELGRVGRENKEAECTHRGMIRASEEQRTSHTDSKGWEKMAALICKGRNDSRGLSQGREPTLHETRQHRPQCVSLRRRPFIKGNKQTRCISGSSLLTAGETSSRAQQHS